MSIMNQLLIATTNQWKTKLFAPLISHYGFEVIALSNIVTSGQAPDENGQTVIENALIKARHYHKADHPWVFADDTGLEIQALNGEPGVQSRRWAGRFPVDVSDQVWLDYLLERMRDVPDGERRAEFVDGWALIEPNGTIHTSEHRAAFEIARQPIWPLVPGSPIMSVAIGLPQEQAELFSAVKSKWDQWGILKELLAK
jgi:non-canonical purine NTP pyrophosphatase (RdgB/HAM1 family)